MSPLTGRVALVTGAGRGIGKGIALTLAAHGAHVVCAARTESQLLEVAERIRRDGGSASANISYTETIVFTNSRHRAMCPRRDDS